MNKSALVVLALFLCVALCAQEAEAWRLLNRPEPRLVKTAEEARAAWWRNRTAVHPNRPHFEPLNPEEIAACKSAHNYTTEEKPCLDEIISSLHQGKNLSVSLTGKLCCSFYWGVKNSCYVHAPTYLLHPQLLEKSCPKP